MPMRVPTVEGPSVAPQGLPGVRQSSVASPDLLGAPSRELQSAGNAVENLGAQFQVQRRQLYDQANAARVDDALNSATEMAMRLQHDKTDGYTTQTGYDALNRASGMPLADEYTGKLKTQVDKIAAGLGNEDQRRMFGMRANNLVTSFMGSALAYETRQQQEYTLSVKDAAVATGKNSIALNPDPDNIAQQTTRIRAAIEGGQDENGNFIAGSAQMQGKSAAWAKEKADEAVSDAHGKAIRGLMEQGNVNMAMAYLKRYGSQMTASDTLEVQGKLQHEYDTHLGATVGNQVFERAAPTVAPTDYDRLTTLVKQAESAGKRYAADGTLLQGPTTRSGERAQGEMQVMPATYKDPGYGIKPADLSGTPQQQADEIARVGQEKLAAMVKRYKGDVPKALAAYNWGEGNVDRAVAEAAQDVATGAFRGGAPGSNYWLTKAPPETQAYVAGITAKYQAGAGVPQKPTLDDLHTQARAVLGPTASTMAVKTATEQITQRYTDFEKGEKQRAEETYSQTLQALQANGGNYPALPASLRADMARLAPARIDDAMKYGTAIAAGQPVQTDWNTYTQLRGMAAANPQGFARTDLRAYYDKLNPTQREQLLDIQTKAKDPNLLPQVMTLEAQLTVAHEQLGLHASDGEKKGKFDDAVSHAISDEMQSKKRALTFEERDTIIKRMMLPTSGTGFLGMGVKKVYQVAGTPDEPTAKPSITDDARSLITSALKAEGIPPTEANILQRFNLRYGIR